MKFVSRVLPALALIGALAAHSPAGSAASPKPAVISCTQITTAAQLQAISRNLTGSYCLANDIDLASISNFVPIGTGSPFFGAFFGNGHVIRNLKISTTSQDVGLFGAVAGGRIQDVGLINVNLNATAATPRVGGLIGFATSGSVIARVFVTGHVACKSTSCMAGGIVGDLQPGVTLADSWSSADVAARATTSASAGGVAGGGGGTITGSYATGNVSCTGTSSFCDAGGLVGGSGPVSQSFATGAVSAPQPSGFAGGLVGDILGQAIQQSYATGPVSGDTAGGLVGQLRSGSSIILSYAIGRVTGTTNAGGLAGHETTGSPTATNSYWDKNTTGQTASVVGTAATTAQLRVHLLQGFGFGAFWAISKGLSFPFFNSNDIGFTSPLATLVRANKVYVFLPISQLDTSLYAGATTHVAAASQATVYDMIARAIGLTDNIAQLKEVRIDKYFWHDAKQTTAWTGPVLGHATFGKLVALSPASTLSPVLAQMKQQRLVILRGTYSVSGGGTATHWMLGTMYLGGVVVANDPWTGTQVSIDVRTKTVTEPAGFPLANFKIDGYQPVAID